jgi:hypothetical protein
MVQASRLVGKAMFGGRSRAACLMYLFAGATQPKRHFRHGHALVEVPGSTMTVRLFPLEALLLTVAIWDGIRTGAVGVAVVPGEPAAQKTTGRRGLPTDLTGGPLR